MINVGMSKDKKVEGFGVNNKFFIIPFFDLFGALKQSTVYSKACVSVSITKKDPVTVRVAPKNLIFILRIILQIICAVNYNYTATICRASFFFPNLLYS